MNIYVGFIFVVGQLQIFAECSSRNVNGSNGSYLESGAQSTSKRDPPPTSDCPPSKGCLPKCCQPNESYNYVTDKCAAVGPELLANLSSRYPQLHILYGRKCPLHRQSPLRDGKYKIHDNGSLEWFKNGLHSYRNYCIDLLAKDKQIHPIICSYEHNYIDRVKLITKLEIIGWATSTVFLAVTFVLYVATPKLRRRVHDRCFICHTVTLILGFASLILIQHKYKDPFVCHFFGYMTQFWLLASFFWLNVISFDMWRNIKTMQTSTESNSTRKLLLYCLYASGCPLLILVITILADKLLPDGSAWTTGLGKESCFFQRSKDNGWLDPKFIYFYSFFSVSLLVNLYTFTDTALVIMQLNKRWRGGNNSDCRRFKRQENRFCLYLNLFLAMGLNWILELISYIVDVKNTFWNCVNVSITFQGVYIFLIFVCNKRVFRILKSYFFPKKRSTLSNRTWMSNRTWNSPQSPTTRSTRASFGDSGYSHDMSLKSINGRANGP